MIKKIITLERIWRNPDTLEVHTSRVSINLYDIVQLEENIFEMEAFDGYGPITYVDTQWIKGQMFRVHFDKMLYKWKKALEDKKFILNQQELN